jgi:hypothetical protein
VTTACRYRSSLTAPTGKAQEFTFFDAASGMTFTDSQVATRKNGQVATTCDLSGSQTDPAGDVFTISGSVGGWLS